MGRKGIKGLCGEGKEVWWVRDVWICVSCSRTKPFLGKLLDGGKAGGALAAGYCFFLNSNIIFLEEVPKQQTIIDQWRDCLPKFQLSVFRKAA